MKSYSLKRKTACHCEEGAKRLTKQSREVLDILELDDIVSRTGLPRLRAVTHFGVQARLDSRSRLAMTLKVSALPFALYVLSLTQIIHKSRI